MARVGAAGRLVPARQLPQPPVEEHPLQGVDGPPHHRPDAGARHLLVAEPGAGHRPGADDGAHGTTEHGGLEEAEAEHPEEAAPGGRKSR